MQRGREGGASTYFNQENFKVRDGLFTGRFVTRDNFSEMVCGREQFVGGTDCLDMVRGWEMVCGGGGVLYQGQFVGRCSLSVLSNFTYNS